jgi:hypothetical protein
VRPALAPILGGVNIRRHQADGVFNAALGQAAITGVAIDCCSASPSTRLRRRIRFCLSTLAWST